jgi:hypothetical protein
MRALLDGSAGPAPAWNLTLQSQLYDNITGMFRMTSDVSVSTEATANAAVLLTALSTVPVTGSLAVPFQECVYEDIINIIDGGVSSLNLETKTVTLSVSKPGTFLSQFGTQVFEYSLNSPGVWSLTFADDWNSILSKTFVSKLPSRNYLGSIETIEPFPEPTPTPTPTPSPTPTVSPSPTPTVLLTPTHTTIFNPAPTLSPNPTTTTSSPTQEPSQTAASTDTKPLEHNAAQSQSFIIAIVTFLALTSLSIIVYTKIKKQVKIQKEK